MGRIRSQSLYTIVNAYAGVVLGFVFVTYLFPRYFSEEEIGFRSFLTEISAILAQVCVFGFGSTINKFYPVYKKGKEDGGFMLLALLIPVISFFLLMMIFILFKPTILALMNAEDGLLNEHFFFILPFVFFNMYFLISEAYAKAHFNIARTQFLRGVLLRILFILSVLIYVFYNLPDDYFWWLYLGCFFVVFLLMISYVFYIGNFSTFFSTNFFHRLHFKPLFHFSLFNFLTAAAAKISFRIDIVMVTAFFGLAEAGVYAYSSYLISLIEIPKKSVMSISIPFISNFWKDRNMGELNNLYKNISSNQFVLGVFILGLLMLLIDYFYLVVPKGDFFASGKWVMFFLGMSKLIDMVFSINGQLLVYTRYSRFNLYFVLTMVVLAVSLNMMLIPVYGINGAAIATMLTYFVFNVMRSYLVWRKLGLQPFSINTFFVFIIGVFGFFVTYFIPDTDYLLISVLMKSLVFSVVYTGLILYFGVSEALMKLVKAFVNKIRK